jgi:hypothetical protein
MSGDAPIRKRRPAAKRAAAAAIAASAVVGSVIVSAGPASPDHAAAPRHAALLASTSVPATTASGLLDIVGVNIHSDYGPTPYGNYPATAKLLANLGVHTVRDDMAYNPNFVRAAQYAFYNTLAAQGIKVDLVLTPSANQSDMAGRLASVAKYFPTAVSAIEGPNELNLSPGNTAWAARDASYAKALATSMRADPTLRSVPVLAPSLANYLAIRNNNQGFLQLGNLTNWITGGNVHNYPGGRDPTWNMDVTLAGVQNVSGTMPVWVTEAGYHDQVNAVGPDASVPDSVIAAYLPRMLLEYAQRHVARVDLYELYDEKADPSLVSFHDHFGLVDLAGKPKPQFNAVSNFDQLLSDGGRAFVPGSLTYSVGSGTTPVSSKLVQKSNGEFVLFLWRDAPLFDTVAQKPIAAPAVPVTVTLGAPAKRIQLFRPSVSGRSQRTVSATSSVTVTVAGDVAALVIKP